jgi:methyl-accepting chemotaxis protein
MAYLEDALKKLDRLTQEVARLALVEVLKITHDARDDLNVVNGKVESVEHKVEGIGDKVEDMGNKVEDVGDKVGDIGDKVQCIDEKVQVLIDGAHCLLIRLLAIF